MANASSWAARWSLCSALVLAVAFAVGCATHEPHPAASVTTHSPVSAPSTATSLDASASTARVSGGYALSCKSYPAVCVDPAPRDAAVPASLWRPLKFPSAARGCPVSATHPQPKRFPFLPWAYGQGPVIAWLEAPEHAKSVKMWGPKMYDTPGLYGVKTLWISKPSYNGPILLRGKRLDATGSVVFGNGNQGGAHEITSMQIPPGGDSGIYDHGYRSWPGGTWVHAPGCYGIQADGTDFTSRFVVQLVK